MGARRNVKLIYKENVIYFYTHWGAEELETDIKNALIRGKNRWDDESYLARIIFSEMIKDEVMGETGFGISPYEIDPDYKTIEINFNENTVDGIPFNEVVEEKGSLSFNEKENICRQCGRIHSNSICDGGMK